MINSLEEALKHANHTVLNKYKHVVVFSDGSIHASDNDLSSLVKDDSFVVKGDSKMPAKKVKEIKEIKSDDII